MDYISSSGKKRILVILALVVFVILILYAAWYTGRIETWLNDVAEIGGRSNPIIIKKKIISFSEKQPQEAEKPHFVIVRKKIISPPASDHAKTAPYSETQDLASAAAKASKEEALKPGTEGIMSPKVLAGAEQTGLPPALESNNHTLEAADTQAKKQQPAVTLHPYSILLSSCRLWKSVSELLSDYRNRNLSPYFVKVDLGESGIWWRVLLGHYQTRQEALKIREKNKLSESLVVKMPYANLVDIFPSEAEAKSMMHHLEKLQQSPYIIRHDSSTFQLFVGAFITKKGAEKEKIGLLSKGIPNKVIER
jgi:hypothetical protein